MPRGIIFVYLGVRALSPERGEVREGLGEVGEVSASYMRENPYFESRTRARLDKRKSRKGVGPYFLVDAPAGERPSDLVLSSLEAPHDTAPCLSRSRSVPHTRFSPWIRSTEYEIRDII